MIIGQSYECTKIRQREEVGACLNSKACVKKLTTGYKLGPVKSVSSVIILNKWPQVSVGVLHNCVFHDSWESEQLVWLLHFRPHDLWNCCARCPV